MGEFDNAIDVCLITTGSVYSLANIESVLGIAILIIQLVWIVCKLTAKIINIIKTKKYNELDETIKEAVDSLETAKSVKNIGDTFNNDSYN